MNKKIAIIISSVVLGFALIATLVIILVKPKENIETYEYNFKVEYYDQDNLVSESEFKGNDVNAFELSDLTVAGKVVEGWYFDKAFNKEFKNERIKLELVENILKLYAKFKLETLYEVTITTYIDDQVYNEKIEEVIEFGLFELPEAVEIEGSTLIGWFLDDKKINEKESIRVDSDIFIELRYKKDEVVVPDVYYMVEFTLFEEVYSSEEKKEGSTIYMPYDLNDEITGEDGLLYVVTGFSYLDEVSGEIKRATNGMRVNQSLNIVINLEKVQKIEIVWGYNQFATSTIFKTGNDYINLSELEINQDFQNILDSGYEFYYRYDEKLYRVDEIISVEFKYSEPIILEAIEVPSIVYELVEKIELSVLNNEQLFIRRETVEESNVVNGTTVFNIKDEAHSDRFATDVNINTNRKFDSSWTIREGLISDYVFESDVNVIYKTEDDKHYSNEYTLVGDLRVRTNMVLNGIFDIFADTIKIQRLTPYEQTSENEIYTRPDVYSANYLEGYVKSLSNFDNLFIKGSYSLDFLGRENYMNSGMKHKVEDNVVSIDLKNIEKNTLFGKFIEQNIIEKIEDADSLKLTIQKIDGEFILELVSEYTTKNFEMFKEIGFSSATSGAIIKGTSTTKIYI